MIITLIQRTDIQEDHETFGGRISRLLQDLQALGYTASLQFCVDIPGRLIAMVPVSEIKPNVAMGGAMVQRFADPQEVAMKLQRLNEQKTAKVIRPAELLG